MKNLVFQYYIPYELNDADMGGTTLPKWAQAGSRSAKKYAEIVGADYALHTNRFFPHLDPRLDSLRLFNDPFFDDYDSVLCLDLDMLINTRADLFRSKDGNFDVAMVHELGVHTKGPSGWLRRVMYPSLEDRGIIAYGKHIFGSDWMFPKSTLYPDEAFRYLNGGLQLWTKQGREKARKHFTSVDHYTVYTRYTEQMYINLQLSQPMFDVLELPSHWNRMPYQWSFGQPDGSINHFLARHKFDMPKYEKEGLSVCRNT